MPWIDKFFSEVELVELVEEVIVQKLHRSGKRMVTLNLE